MILIEDFRDACISYLFRAWLKNNISAHRNSPRLRNYQLILYYILLKKRCLVIFLTIIYVQNSHATAICANFSVNFQHIKKSSIDIDDFSIFRLEFENQ